MCELTGLRPATMSSLVNELLSEKLLREVGNEPALSHGGPGGRRQVLVDINPDAAFFLGIHLGVRTCAVAISDLRGNLRTSRVLRRPSGRVGPDDALQTAVQLAQELLWSREIDTQRVLGIGVSSIGVVDPVAGVLRYVPELQWHSVPARQVFESELGLPVVVDNSRRAMMMGELLFGVARRARNVLLVHLATTVGAALVVNGELVYGDSFGAGQLGHVVVDPHGEPCACGARGCLETVIGELALLRQARQVARRQPDTLILALADGDVEKIEPPLVYQAAAQGDPAATALIARVAYILGQALVPALGLLDPELLIVTGEIQLAEACFLQSLAETIDVHLPRVLGHTIPAVPSSFGSQANLLGAVSLALNRFYSGRDTERDRSPQQADSLLNDVGTPERVVPKLFRV